MGAALAKRIVMPELPTNVDLITAMAECIDQLTQAMREWASWEDGIPEGRQLKAYRKGIRSL